MHNTITPLVSLSAEEYVVEAYLFSVVMASSYCEGYVDAAAFLAGGSLRNRNLMPIVPAYNLLYASSSQSIWHCIWFWKCEDGKFRLLNPGVT